MIINKNTVGISAEQLANGTPQDRILELKSFYKGDRATISPAKDINGRYLGINVNIPDIKKLEMGYVPSIESVKKLYDGIIINLNDKETAADWEWMKHCTEIADNFEEGQHTPGAYFYVFRKGFESAKKVNEMTAKVALMNYILNDSNENLYNRVSILGVDMSQSAISDVKEYMLGLVNLEPEKIQAVYESKTFTLELLFMHALKKGVIQQRNGIYTFGEILLGLDNNAVVSYFANAKNSLTTRAVEAITYGNRTKAANPLENESVSRDDDDSHEDDNDASDTVIVEDGNLKKSTLESEGDLTPQQKAAITRKNNANKK